MIKLTKNTFYKEKETRENLASFILESSKLSMGGYCGIFEQTFAEWQGREYAVMFNSGSSANLALIQSLMNMFHLKAGDNVGVSALTWSTNVMPIMQLGMKPVGIDININNLNVMSNNIPSDLRCLFLTNALGLCGDIRNIAKYCKDNGILLIEDNCESLGSVYGKTKLGNFGEASTFSFYVGHHLSTIEGGMVCTDNQALYNNLKMVRSHGWVRDTEQYVRDNFKKIYDVDDFNISYTFFVPGYNLRPTEINGAIGLFQMRYLHEIIEKRYNNFKKYQKAFKNLDYIMDIDTTGLTTVSNFAYPLIITQGYKEIKDRLMKEVEIRPLLGGNIFNQPFMSDYGSDMFTSANIASRLGLYIPNNPDLTDEEIDRIINIVANK
jgi:CDP-6-deoxy-D-xylo-4-hexulose-3-dehydrase